MGVKKQERRWRRRQFDWCPWLFWDEAGDAEIARQLDYQAFLAGHGVRAGERCYLSERATVIASEDAPVTLGDRSYIAAQAYVTGPVTLGADCSVNPHAVVRGPVTAGDGVRIGSHAQLIGFNHGFARLDQPIFRQPHTSLGVTLGDDIWAGAGAIVLDGVTVGSGAILAAGAVVTHDVDAATITAGNPARPIRRRDGGAL